MDNLTIDREHLLSKNFQNLEQVSQEEKANYLNAKPFPNIVLNNFFNDKFLNIILKEFPDLSKLNESQNYKTKNEIKLSNKNYNKFSQNIKSFVDFLNSSVFLTFLQNITSIKEKLISDPRLEGGGLHEIKSGGVLKIHTDFNRHPFLDLDRRVNVLIYLNKKSNCSRSRYMKFVHSINKSLENMLKDHGEVILYGEDLLDPYGGAFKRLKDNLRNSQNVFYQHQLVKLQ